MLISMAADADFQDYLIYGTDNAFGRVFQGGVAWGAASASGATALDAGATTTNKSFKEKFHYQIESGEKIMSIDSFLKFSQ